MKIKLYIIFMNEFDYSFPFRQAGSKFTCLESFFNPQTV